MASYSATMIIKGTTGEPMAASGSFRNINIDGRLSFTEAVNVARFDFEKEAKARNIEYMGFAIEKTHRFVNYTNPKIIDSKLTAKEITYLL